MAKSTPKAKSRPQSTHSRAARRATSPSINTDKSLKDVKPPEDILQPDDILAARQGSGVSKKPKQKPLSRQQRLRKEKGMARAEAVVDQHEIKISKSKESARNIDRRRAAWEELNSTGKSKKKAAVKKNPFQELASGDDAMEDLVVEKSTADIQQPQAAPPTAAAADAMDALDQIT